MELVVFVACASALLLQGWSTAATWGDVAFLVVATAAVMTIAKWMGDVQVHASEVPIAGVHECDASEEGGAACKKARRPDGDRIDGSLLDEESFLLALVTCAALFGWGWDVVFMVIVAGAIAFLADASHNMPLLLVN